MHSGSHPTCRPRIAIQEPVTVAPHEVRDGPDHAGPRSTVRGFVSLTWHLVFLGVRDVQVRRSNLDWRDLEDSRGFIYSTKSNTGGKYLETGH